MSDSRYDKLKLVIEKRDTNFISSVGTKLTKKTNSVIFNYTYSINLTVCHPKRLGITLDKQHPLIISLIV